MAELLLSKLFINDNIPSSSNKFLLIWDWLFVVLPYAVDDKISKKNIIVINDNSSVELKPNKQFSIDFEIDFPSKLISKQSCQLQLINGNYKSDIASARTFGFE